MKLRLQDHRMNHIKQEDYKGQERLDICGKLQSSSLHHLNENGWIITMKTRYMITR